MSNGNIPGRKYGFHGSSRKRNLFCPTLAIAVDIVDGSDGRMLSGLDGILFCRQTVSVISHWVEYIEALQSFVTGVNIRSNVSQRMTYV